MPTEPPARSRIPAPTSRASATPSSLAPPGTTRSVALRAKKSASSLRPPPPSPGSVPKSPSPSPSGSRIRAKTPNTPSRPRAPQPNPPSPSLEGGMARLSVKEQIAQRRAMLREQPAKSTVNRPIDDEWGGGRGVSGKTEEVDILGRASMLVDITRAKTTGKLDLSFRELPCLPYALFNLHLGLEPSFPPPPPRDPTEKEVKQPSFYECVDLVSLRARDNMIEEIQGEISYFVSLKTLDVGLVCRAVRSSTELD
ncbi:hypothetical protein CALCODRAFT_501684 [Calocera cornea HHB12733]|uniref:Uncharacterized protein n=1 Tax=Calocera cornea HHB12733 TaxID=1353952 RepID=A0A165DJA3_9BASI|nr:hypothetical protein CALCODRAFT_501684 [Calocera cornea HHB12733]